MAHKRQFQDADSEKTSAEEKRYRRTLQSVVLDAVKADAMQKFWVVLEPILRRVVREEVERAIAKYLPCTKHGSRLPSKPLECSETTSLRLEFQNKLALPLYTGRKVEGENGSLIRVSLQDAATGDVVILDDESAVKLDIVVLEGDFPDVENKDWGYEEFENHVVKERGGKGPLLMGDLSILLREGSGTLGELIFTDNSSWIRSRKFRLGVRLSSGYLNGVRVREAKTEAFFVKDHRGQLYKKHYPPKLSDDVWRLEKIGKDGAYHKRLCEYRVKTVEDFLVLFSTGPSKLREIFGATMSTRTWDSIIEHAKTCVLNETQHVYYSDNTRTNGVILNTIYQPLGIVRYGKYLPASSLSDTEQVYVDGLVQEAHSNMSSLHKFPARSNNMELDAFTGSGCAREVVNGFLQADVSEGQHFQGQRTAHNMYGSSGTTFGAGHVPNILQSDKETSAIGLGIKPSLIPNAFSPGTLESIFACGNHYSRESEPLGDNQALYQSLSRYGEDYNNGRTCNQWHDELEMVVSVSTSPFLNATISEDLKYTIPRSLNAQNFDVNESILHRRPYMGWRKLKVVLKCSYVMKKLASKHKIQIEQLNQLW